MRQTRARFVFACVAAGVLGCGDQGEMATLRLSLSGISPLQNGFHYEGWAIVDGQPRPTGKFNVDAGGALVTVAGAPIPSGEFRVGFSLARASAIVITIEPAGDTDAVPTATHYLAGPVSGASATLTVGAPQALANTFATAAGLYVLATPTDGMNNNEKSGVWFLDLTSGAPAVGLTLPALPTGWKYEGWAVIAGKPVTTGRFSSATGADAAAPYSGPMAAPPFPGEDFLQNAPSGLTFPADLSLGMAVITIEPEPDDSPAPFTLKPLVATIPSAAADHQTYTMENRASQFPSGTATIR